MDQTVLLDAKRLSNAIPNYIMVFILFNILSFLLIALGLGKGDMQAAPFVVMAMAIAPLDFVVGLIMYYPDRYGNEQITYIFLFIVMLFFEAIYFTTIDILTIRKFNRGKMGYITLQDMNGNNPGLFRIFIRNLLKAISRVLLMLPFLTLFFTKKKQTLYDTLTNIVVIYEPLNTTRV